LNESRKRLAAYVPALKVDWSDDLVIILDHAYLRASIRHRPALFADQHGDEA